MQAQEALIGRRSVRAYSFKPIPRNFIERLIDCARLAPTARNVQPWEFVAVTQKETLKKLGALADNGKFIAQANYCIAVFCQDTKYYLEDGCAATENILIAAQDLGLGACWVAGDKKPYCQDVKELLAAPKALKLVSLIAVGYAQSQVALPAKKSLKTVLHWEKFGQR